MRTTTATALTALLLGGSAGLARANAFYLSEQDAEATGRGFANAASDIEPSAIVYNPGGIAVGHGTAVSLGASVVAANASFTPDGGAKEDTTTGPQVVPNAFITSRVHEVVSVGIGFHAPFGSAIDWKDDAQTADVLQHLSLRTYFISPVIGINLHKYVPGLTLGGGVDFVPATVELTQQIDLGEDHGSAHLGGTAFGIGGRAGVQYHPAALKALQVGVMWRSQVKEDFDGTGDFDSPAQYRSTLPPDGKITTSVTLPQSVSGGIAYRPIPELQAEVDVSWVGWSSFNTLQINLPGNTAQTTQEQYKDTTTVRVGVEYAMPNIQTSFRAGYIYDPTPIDPKFLTVQLPDTNRNDVTLGATYHINHDYAAALGLLYVIPSSRHTEMSNAIEYQGKADVSAFVASLSLRARFGR